MSETFGTMDKAYFMSKNEIINWINSILKIGITKIEQCATGAVYCQLLDVLFPGNVNMKKVNWSASSETDFLANFKILQQGLNASCVKKEIDIQKLAKGRYQDNFEFCQWFRGYYNQLNRQEFSYDPIARRNGAVLTYLNHNAKNGNANNKKGEASSHFQFKAGAKIGDNKRPNRSNDHCNKENALKSATVKGGFKKNLNVATIKLNINSGNLINEEGAQISKSMVGGDMKMKEATLNPMPKMTLQQIMDDPVLKAEVTDYCYKEIEQQVNEKIKMIQDANAVNEEKVNHLNEQLMLAQQTSSSLTTENFNLKNDLDNVKLTLADTSTEKDFSDKKLECIGYLCGKTTSLNASELKSFILKIIESPYDLEIVMKENDVPEVIERQSG